MDVSPSSRRYRLSVAYISLSVARKISGESEELSLIPGYKQVAAGMESEQIESEESDTMIVSVEKSLQRSPRLIIRGQAGSGKTTLLKWIAVQSAGEKFRGELENWNNTIPFFIPLRQCIESGLPAPEEFPRLLQLAISGEMPEQWVHRQLRSGRAIVLVDGVDEVPKLKRDDVYEWIKDLSETYDGTPLHNNFETHCH